MSLLVSTGTYPCQWVSESVSGSLIVSDLEIAIASPSFASFLGKQLSGNIVRGEATFSHKEGVERRRGITHSSSWMLYLSYLVVGQDPNAQKHKCKC